MKEELTIVQVEAGSLKMPAVVFSRSADALSLTVRGCIANSVPTSDSGKSKLRNWKQNVACASKSHRGPEPWTPSRRYAVSIGFAFHMASHGSRSLDIENFIKPTVDALAAGLFCDAQQDPAAIARFNYDDSCFHYLFVQRLPDALAPDEEGVLIHLSISEE